MCLKKSDLSGGLYKTPSRTGLDLGIPSRIALDLQAQVHHKHVKEEFKVTTAGGEVST